jgi:hypothetical protein
MSAPISPPIKHDGSSQFDLIKATYYDFTMKIEAPSKLNVVRRALLDECVTMCLNVSELRSDTNLPLDEILAAEDEPIIVGEDGVVLFGKATFTKYALLARQATIEVYVYPSARLSWADWNRTYLQLAS